MKFDKRVNFMSRASQYRRMKLKVDKVEVTGDSSIVYASGPNDQGTTLYARFNLLREKGQWKVWRDTFGTAKGVFSNEWP